MRLERRDLDHLALLCRLSLTGEEKARFETQLNEIKDAVEKIAELDLEGIEPVSIASPLANVFREDAPQASLPREEVLRAAPQQDGQGFLVPRVI